MIKLWHEECKGKGIIERHNGLHLLECSNCSGKGYTEHVCSLDDLECADIERELLKSNNLVYSLIDVNSLGTTYVVVVGNFEGDLHKERGATKLEALRKAKAWLDEKDGE